jgi:hypothetical protein
LDNVDKSRLRVLLGIINFGWAIWALVGGYYFITAHEVLGTDTTFMVFDKITHGYHLVGFSLLGCGVISLLATASDKLKKVAAILCAVWCGVTAIALQAAVSGLDQTDIDAWLLLMCAFTCVCRWALLVLEPHVLG